MDNVKITSSNNQQPDANKLRTAHSSVMGQVTPAARNLARQLLAYESESEQSKAEFILSAQRIFEKMRGLLSSFVGPAGFNALLSRALALAAMEHFWLSGVKANQNGSLVGMSEAARQEDLAETGAAFAAILVHLIGLLQTLIGMKLCMRLMQGVWPNVSVDNIIADTTE